MHTVYGYLDTVCACIYVYLYVFLFFLLRFCLNIYFCLYVCIWSYCDSYTNKEKCSRSSHWRRFKLTTSFFKAPIDILHHHLGLSTNACTNRMYVCMFLKGPGNHILLYSILLLLSTKYYPVTTGPYSQLTVNTTSASHHITPLWPVCVRVCNSLESCET